MKPRIRQRLGLALVFGLCCSLAAAGYGTSLLGSGSPSRAIADTPAPGANATPADLHQPPASFDPGWADGYYLADAALPRRDQAVGEIHVGPTQALTGGTPCSQDALAEADYPQSAGSTLGIDPGYLPADAKQDEAARVSRTFAVTCDGQLVTTEVTYARAAAPDAAARVANGESWFSVPTGGFIRITKTVLWGPNDTSNIAAQNWEATTINGLPAAVGKPILDAGLGEGTVLTWDPKTGILTVVDAVNLSTDQLIKVAEGIR